MKDNRSLSLRGAQATKQSHNVRRLSRWLFEPPRNDAKKFSLFFFFFFFLALNLFLIPLGAQELREEIKQEIPVVGKVSYKIQKYSGFNSFVDFFVESIVKIVVKLKTHPENIHCKLEIFSGWDLLRKKAKSFYLDASNLKIKNVPIEYLEVVTHTPIYFKKNQKKKYKAIYPLEITGKIVVNPNSIIEIIDKKSKQSKDSHKVKLPLPPFGSTEVLLKDLMIQINENGFIQSTVNAVSAENPDSEPLKARFSGNLIISDKKLRVSGLECEIEDIFTKDSDVSMSFCYAVEDLINPVVNFNKYEKRGITIDNVDLSYPQNKLILKLNLTLHP